MKVRNALVGLILAAGTAVTLTPSTAGAETHEFECGNVWKCIDGVQKECERQGGKFTWYIGQVKDVSCRFTTFPKPDSSASKPPERTASR